MEFGERRLGNWVVAKLEKDGVPCIQIKPVSGEYLWRYSAMDVMYHALENVLDTDGIEGGLQTCLGVMGGFLHAQDPVFYDLYLKCLEEYGKIAEVRKPTTREEERDIIAEMKVRYDLDEVLKTESCADKADATDVSEVAE